jgi:hypothetical protein
MYASVRQLNVIPLSRSAERDAQGAWAIEPRELHRVFPPLPQTPAQTNGGQGPGQDGEVALLRTMVEELRSTVADLRRREDDLKAGRRDPSLSRCAARSEICASRDLSIRR